MVNILGNRISDSNLNPRLDCVSLHTSAKASIHLFSPLPAMDK